MNKKYYTYKGKKYTMTELSEMSGINKQTLVTRICTQKMDIEEAVEKSTNKKKMYMYKGKECTMDELVKMSGLEKTTIYSRIQYHGYSVEEAVDTPLKIKKYLYKGKMYSIGGLSVLCGIDTGTIYERLKRGWSIEKTVEVPKGHYGERVTSIKKDISDYEEEVIKENRKSISRSLDEIYKSSLLKRPVY